MKKGGWLTEEALKEAKLKKKRLTDGINEINELNKRRESCLTMKNKAG